MIANPKIKDDNFREKYHRLWGFRKQHFPHGVSEVPAEFLHQSPQSQTSQVSRPFYYKDSYEISSVQQFLSLFTNFLDKNEKIKAEKAQTQYKKNLLSQLKLENLQKSKEILERKRKLKLEANRIFSLSLAKKAENTEKDDFFQEHSSQIPRTVKNPYEAETKWMTVKEVDIQLSRILSLNYKEKHETPLNDQLLKSPMFKKGAKTIDHAFTYYIEKRLKERKSSLADIKSQIPKISLFQRNASMHNNSQIAEFKHEKKPTNTNFMISRLTIGKK